MKTEIPTVYLTITSFQFAIGGEHFYGKLHYHMLRKRKGREYREVEVTHRLTKSEAEYLNKKDGLTSENSHGFEWKAGKLSERFHDRESVIASARKQWRRAFPSAVLLVKGRPYVGDPQTVLEGPKLLKRNINALVEKAEKFGRWRNERAMRKACDEYEELLERAARNL